MTNEVHDPEHGLGVGEAIARLTRTGAGSKLMVLIRSSPSPCRGRSLALGPGTFSNRHLGQINAAGRPYAALVKVESPRRLESNIFPSLARYVRHTG
jgi:hypothetical protein